MTTNDHADDDCLMELVDDDAEDPGHQTITSVLNSLYFLNKKGNAFQNLLVFCNIFVEGS